jgi:hypothetical protein
VGALPRSASRSEAARLFAKVPGEIEAQGLAHVAATAAQALTAGTPVLLAQRSTPPVAPLEAGAVPAALRDVDVASGRAADYDGWLTAVPA